MFKPKQIVCNNTARLIISNSFKPKSNVHILNSITTQSRNKATSASNESSASSPSPSSSTVDSTPKSACPYHQQQEGEVDVKEVKPWTQIPGPKGWPLIGNVLDLKNHSSNLPNYFYSLCEEYGDMVKLTVFNYRMVMIANPFILGELLKKEERRQQVDSFRHYKLSKNRILTPVEMKHDEDWNSIRQLYNIAMKPEFQAKITLPQLTELNGDFLRRLVKNLQQVEGSDKLKYVNTSETNSRYAFDSVLKVFLGVKMTDELASTLPFDIREFVDYTVKATDIAVRLDTKVPFYKYFKTKEYENFETVMDKSSEYAKYCIERFKTNPSQNERLLELLRDRAKDQERPEERVESVLMQFLQAGVDITVRIFNHCMHRLAHHTEYQEKIYRETVEVFGEPTLEELTSENGLQVTMEQYKQLKHTRNFIEEVLRLNSFGFLTMGRELNQDTELGGYMIPKDTVILSMQRWTTLKDEYVPRGNEFLPERHEKGSPLAAVNNYVSMPFGVGARKCPGSRIATTEMHFGIINAVRHFKLSHENPNQMPPTSFDQSLLYIDSEKHPIYFTPKEHVKEFVGKNSIKL